MFKEFFRKIKIDRDLEQAKRHNRNSRDLKILSLSEIAIYIAIASFLTTALFSYLDWSWEKSQTEILNAILEESKKTNEFFDKYR